MYLKFKTKIETKIERYKKMNYTIEDMRTAYEAGYDSAMYIGEPYTKKESNSSFEDFMEIIYNENFEELDDKDYIIIDGELISVDDYWNLIET